MELYNEPHVSITLLLYFQPIHQPPILDYLKANPRHQINIQYVFTKVQILFFDLTLSLSQKNYQQFLDIIRYSLVFNFPTWAHIYFY